MAQEQKPKQQASSVFALRFLTFWLTLWTLGVSVISNLLATEGGTFWLFAFTHGGAQIGVSWLLAGQFADAAERHAAPPELSLDLAAMRAQWGGGAGVTALLTGFCLVGLFIGTLLGAGTWAPVLQEASPDRILIALGLSAAWGTIAWRWGLALRRILQAQERVLLVADLDEVSVTRRRPLREIDHTFPAARLSAAAQEGRLTLTGPDASLSLRCADTPAREQLVHTLNEMAARAAQAPAQQPPLPAVLAALRATPEP